MSSPQVEFPLGVTPASWSSSALPGILPNANSFPRCSTLPRRRFFPDNSRLSGSLETTSPRRHLVPNHLFQLMTMTAMEPPISFDADEVRNKQAEVLHAIQPLSPEDVLKNNWR
jgi:hypothetical protein